MSDWYLDLIPRRLGERPEDAVERVYPGFLDDEEQEAARLRSEAATGDVPVCRQANRWMKSVVEQLLGLDVGLTVTGSQRDEGRRWPYLVELESDLGALDIRVSQDSITIRPLGHAETDEHWRRWWKVIRHFARQGYVAVFSDGMDIWNVRVSYSAARARDDAMIF